MLELLQVRGDAEEGRLVVPGPRELEQLGRVGEAAAHAPERADHGLERLLFLAELLRALRVGPDLRLRELALDFG
jgi:hypothetical protein